VTPAEARVRQGFAAQPFMASIGATLARVEPGEVEIHLPCTSALLQHTGVVHAGAVTAVVDSACGFAAATLMPEHREVVSVEFKLNLLAPASGEHLEAIGRVARVGRTLTVCTGEVWSVSGLSRQRVAIMQATMMAVTRRTDGPAADGEVSLS
jgi:uncharacterized protein (TIGR00369 family)